MLCVVWGYSNSNRVPNNINRNPHFTVAKLKSKFLLIHGLAQISPIELWLNCDHPRSSAFRLQLSKSKYQKHEWKFGRWRIVVATRSDRWVFPQLFGSSPKLFWVSLQLYFLFPLQNPATKKKQTTCLLRSSKRKFSLLAVNSLC